MKKQLLKSSLLLCSILASSLSLQAQTTSAPPVISLTGSGRGLLIPVLVNGAGQVTNPAATSLVFTLHSGTKVDTFLQSSPLSQRFLSKSASGDFLYEMAGVGSWLSNSVNSFFGDATGITNAHVGVLTVTADTSASAFDEVILINGATKTVTLPTSVGKRGKVYLVKLIASSTGTVATTSSQTIDGSTTYSLSAQYKWIRVVSDGANWHDIGHN